MRRLFVLLSLALGPGSLPGYADDACSSLAIETRADVTVSDGSFYRTETYFRSAHHAAFVQRSDDGETVIAVEGPLSWVRADGSETEGVAFHKLFALGHQFHAFLLHFETMTEDIDTAGQVVFLGEIRDAISGDYPYGGRVHLVRGAEPDRPSGFVFEFPDIPAISVQFDDWRDHAGTAVPFVLVIDDGTRQFTYRYTDVSTVETEPLWFMQAVGKVDLDSVNVYRLHRRLLAAHCLGDADALAELSAPEVLSANRGALSQIDQATTQARYSHVFDAVDYTEYHDLKDPVIRVSEAGDLAWIGVEVLARGLSIQDQEPFEMQWSWIMIAEKIGDDWKHAGNASSMLTEISE